LTDDDWSSVKCGCQISFLQITYKGRDFEANLQATRQSHAFHGLRRREMDGKDESAY